jgi:hypothetical protein
MAKKQASTNSLLSWVVWWFEFIMILVAYISAVPLFVRRGLDLLEIALFILLLVYIAGKIWFFASNRRK